MLSLLLFLFIFFDGIFFLLLNFHLNFQFSMFSFRFAEIPPIFLFCFVCADISQCSAFLHCQFPMKSSWTNLKISLHVRDLDNKVSFAEVFFYENLDPFLKFVEKCWACSNRAQWLKVPLVASKGFPFLGQVLTI